MRKLLVAVVVLVVGCALTAQANLLLNPSFETAGSQSWEPLNWSRSDQNDRTESLSWDGGVGYWVQNGSYVMNLNCATSGLPQNHSLNQDLSVGWLAVGDTVTFSIYAFANDNKVFTEAYLDLGLKGGAGGDVWYSNLSFASGLSNQTWASGWVQYSFVVTNTAAGANEVSAWLNVMQFDDSAGNANIMFDSASLTIPEPVSAALLGIAGVALFAARRRSSK